MNTMMRVNGSAPALTEAQQQKTEAAALWRVTRDNGHVMTGKELGTRFGKGERWGQSVIADVKSASTQVRNSVDAEPSDQGDSGAAERVPGALAVADFGDVEMMSPAGAYGQREANAAYVEPNRMRIPRPAESPVSPPGYGAGDSGPHAGAHAVFGPQETDPQTARAAWAEPHMVDPNSADPADETVLSVPQSTGPRTAHKRPADSSHTAHKKRALGTFYALVLILALTGQTTAAEGWVPIGDPDSPNEPVWLLVVRLTVAGVFALVLELGAFVLLLEVADRAATGERSRLLPLIGAFGLTGVAAFITSAGHWGDTQAAQIAAVAFCLVTVIGFVTWLIRLDWKIRPEHERRKHVEKAVEAYVRGLDMPQAEKDVLLSSVGADEIAARLTRELDNDAIADRLAAAIAPAAWRTADEKSQVN